MHRAHLVFAVALIVFHLILGVIVSAVTAQLPRGLLQAALEPGLARPAWHDTQLVHLVLLVCEGVPIVVIAGWLLLFDVDAAAQLPAALQVHAVAWRVSAVQVLAAESACACTTKSALARVCTTSCNHSRL